MSLSDCCTPDEGPKVIQPGKQKLLSRLNRIEGQVRGVIKMVDEDRYCVDVLTQISAIKSAMDSVAMQLLENHAHGCVAQAIKDGEGDAAIDELMMVVKKLSGKTLG